MIYFIFKTRVLLSVVWQTIFLFLNKLQKCFHTRMSSFSLPLVVWLHSFINSFSSTDEQLDSEELDLPSELAPVIFHGAAELGPQVLRLGYQCSSTRLWHPWGPRTCWQGCNLIPSRAWLKGASQWRALSMGFSSSEQKHAGVSAQGSVPPSSTLPGVARRWPSFSWLWVRVFIFSQQVKH